MAKGAKGRRGANRAFRPPALASPRRVPQVGLSEANATASGADDHLDVASTSTVDWSVRPDTESVAESRVDMMEEPSKPVQRLEEEVATLQAQLRSQSEELERLTQRTELTERLERQYADLQSVSGEAIAARETAERALASVADTHIAREEHEQLLAQARAAKAPEKGGGDEQSNALATKVESLQSDLEDAQRAFTECQRGFAEQLSEVLAAQQRERAEAVAELQQRLDTMERELGECRTQLEQRDLQLREREEQLQEKEQLLTQQREAASREEATRSAERQEAAQHAAEQQEAARRIAELERELEKKAAKPADDELAPVLQQLGIDSLNQGDYVRERPVVPALTPQSALEKDKSRSANARLWAAERTASESLGETLALVQRLLSPEAQRAPAAQHSELEEVHTQLALCRDRLAASAREP